MGTRSAVVSPEISGLASNGQVIFSAWSAWRTRMSSCWSILGQSPAPLSLSRECCAWADRVLVCTAVDWHSLLQWACPLAQEHVQSDEEFYRLFRDHHCEEGAQPLYLLAIPSDQCCLVPHGNCGIDGVRSAQPGVGSEAQACFRKACVEDNPDMPRQVTNGLSQVYGLLGVTQRARYRCSHFDQQKRRRIDRVSSGVEFFKKRVALLGGGLT